MKLNGNSWNLEDYVPVNVAAEFVLRYVCRYCRVAYSVEWYETG
jgi:hypothetical protein